VNKAMSRFVGFVILATRTPLTQTARLVTKLDTMFEHPPIAVHYDFSQCSRAECEGWVAAFPKNVWLVQAGVVTQWARFGVVEATIHALDQMYRSGDGPEWWTSMSGSDYPIKPAARILRDLEESPYDAHMDHERIYYGMTTYPWQDCHGRYCGIHFRVPFLSRRLRPVMREFTIEHPWLTRPFVPFSKTLECYSGEAWMSGRRKTAEYILEFHRTHPAFAGHYRKVLAPDESYFQTILGNAQQMKLSKDHFRYIDWPPYAHNPKVLTMEDLPAIKLSGAHFARKFDLKVDASVLDELDMLTR